MNKIQIVMMLVVVSLSVSAAKYEKEVQTFKAKAKYILTLLESESNNSLQNIDLFRLKINIKTTDIEFTKKNLKDKYGHIKTALNYPGRKLIKVNIKQWQELLSDEEILLPLILHEYLGISGEEVDNYRQSQLITEINKEFLKIKANSFTYLESLDTNVFSDRLKIVKSRNFMMKNKKIYGSFYMKDIFFLYDLNRKSVVSEFGIRKNSSMYRPKTIWDEDSPNAVRDKICQDLGFDISIGFKKESGHIYYYGRRILELNLKIKRRGVLFSNGLGTTEAITNIQCRAVK